jgi:endonuclease/exonuclease/phosphatase family metal-dependent hydrolase
MSERLFFSAVFVCVAGCGKPPLEPRDPDPGAVHFKVQTFNVEFQHSQDAPTVEAIGDADADIVALQEVTYDWEDVIVRRYGDRYPYMLFRPNHGTGGLAVLSRYSLSDQGFLEAFDGSHPSWHVEAETPMGTVQLLVVHLRSVFASQGNAIKAAEAYFSTGSAHLAEIQYYSSYIAAGRPTLVLGDFNEEPDGEAIRFLEHRGYENILPLYHPGQPTWRYPPSWQFEQSLDHILFDHSFEPLDAYVVDKGNSDHIPVVAHLEAAPR